MNPMESVKEFHEVYGLPIADKPGQPSADQAELRRNLLSEEYWEYDRAVDKNDLVGISDALADMIYIICGTAHVYGLPLNDIFNEVHRSNMSKLDSDGKPIYREDGKVLKGPNFEEPNIKKILGMEE